MSDLVVNRWRRYGKDRLYVQTAEGDTRVGWYDLLADEAHPETEEGRDVLTRAVAEWQAAQGAPAVEAPQSDSGPEPQPVEVPASQPERPWIDLATNRPGAEAREQADAAWGAAPVRSTVARVLGVHTTERAWRIGADGEEKVADQLAKAAKKDPRWRFLHSVPVGDRGSDIDHVIIGPGGVFTVNTKHHPRATIWVGGNTLMVNGARQPYVRNARHEAERATRLLSDACGFPVLVSGLIVTVNAADVVVKAQPVGVSVVPRMQVANWLLRHGDVLAPESVETVFEAARRSTTWTARG